MGIAIEDLLSLDALEKHRVAGSRDVHQKQYGDGIGQNTYTFGGHTGTNV